jgi:hypothetical protein
LKAQRKDYVIFQQCAVDIKEKFKLHFNKLWEILYAYYEHSWFIQMVITKIIMTKTKKLSQNTTNISNGS